jgi:hypothetical protein
LNKFDLFIIPDSEGFVCFPPAQGKSTFLFKKPLANAALQKGAIHQRRLCQ